MLRAVAEAFSEGRHLMVEAGTGTGKSMAYLVPAFAWAAANGQRVVVSTNTINLQDQLLRKDIPDLAQALGMELPASVLKGRANYLCPRRLDVLRRLGPRTGEEMRLAAKVLVWLAGGGSGDRGEINLLGPAEAAAWMRLSAEGDECSSETCEQFAGGTCPYYNARRVGRSRPRPDREPCAAAGRYRHRQPRATRVWLLDRGRSPPSRGGHDQGAELRSDRGRDGALAARPDRPAGGPAGADGGRRPPRPAPE